jgi:RNA polymerase sigma factor (sigma-70 family)
MRNSEKKAKEVERCQREIEEFMNCAEHEEGEILNRLLYPLDRTNRFSIDGKPMTWLAGHIRLKAGSFLRANVDYRTGVDFKTVQTDVIGEIALAMYQVLTDLKRNPRKIGAKWYFYLERAVENKVTDMQKAHLAQKREIERRTVLLGENESLDDYYYRQLCGGTSIDWMNPQEDEILNRLTVEAMINDESLTGEERAVLVLMYEDPCASHQEIADELGLNRRTVSRIIQRLGKKLVRHVSY